jgi:glycosyltransferase involved in cell wall biosynthesis
MSEHNILYIVSCLERGGLELRLLDFARRFPDNYTIHICVTSDRLDLLDRFRATNAKVFVVPIKRAYCEFSKIAEIYKYILANEIWIVNTYDFKGLLLGCIIKARERSRIALIHNTVDLLHSYKGRHKFALKLLFFFVNISVCNSEQARDVLVALGIKSSSIKVITNGVDTEIFQPDIAMRNTMRTHYSIVSDETVIGTVDNFRWEKNYPFLIESFALLTKKYPKLRLLCVGGGGAIEEIKSLVEERGLKEKVLFAGSVDNVPDYMSMMDIFVLCSLKESFPNALIQAMSMRLPVVVSDIGACNIIVTDSDNGFTYESNNTGNFISKIEQLLSDRGLRSQFADKGAVVVNERYSLGRMVQKYLTLYEHIL